MIIGMESIGMELWGIAGVVLGSLLAFCHFLLPKSGEEPKKVSPDEILIEHAKKLYLDDKISLVELEARIHDVFLPPSKGGVPRSGYVKQQRVNGEYPDPSLVDWNREYEREKLDLSSVFQTQRIAWGDDLEREAVDAPPTEEDVKAHQKRQNESVRRYESERPLSRYDYYKEARRRQGAKWSVPDEAKEEMLKDHCRFEDEEAETFEIDQLSEPIGFWTSDHLP